MLPNESEVKQLLTNIETKFNNRNFDGAEADANRLLSLADTWETSEDYAKQTKADAYVLLAHIHTEMGNIDQAFRDCQAALELCPEYKLIHETISHLNNIKSTVIDKLGAQIQSLWPTQTEASASSLLAHYNFILRNKLNLLVADLKNTTGPNIDSVKTASTFTDLLRKLANSPDPLERYDIIVELIPELSKLNIPNLEELIREIFTHFVDLSAHILYKCDYRTVISVKESLLHLPSFIEDETTQYTILYLAHLALKNNSKAIKYIKKVLEISPNNIRAQISLAMAYNELQNFSAADDAIKNIKGELNEKDSYRILCIHASTLIGLNKTDEAKQKLEKAIKLNNSGIEAYLVRSDLYFRLGKWYLAKKDIDHALRLAAEFDSTHPNTRSLLLNVYIKAAKYYLENLYGDRNIACALQYAQYATHLDGNNTDAQALKDKAELKLMRYKSAKEDAEAALQLDFYNQDANIKLIELHIKSLDYPAAYNATLLYLSTFPKNAYILSLQAKVCVHKNDFDSAINRAKASIGLDPFDESTHEILALAYFSYASFITNDDEKKNEYNFLGYLSLKKAKQLKNSDAGRNLRAKLFDSDDETTALQKSIVAGANSLASKAAYENDIEKNISILDNILDVDLGNDPAILEARKNAYQALIFSHLENGDQVSALFYFEEASKNPGTKPADRVTNSIQLIIKSNPELKLLLPLRKAIRDFEKNPKKHQYSDRVIKSHQYVDDTISIITLNKLLKAQEKSLRDEADKLRQKNSDPDYNLLKESKPMIAASYITDQIDMFVNTGRAYDYRISVPSTLIRDAKGDDIPLLTLQIQAYDRLRIADAYSTLESDPRSISKVTFSNHRRNDVVLLQQKALAALPETKLLYSLNLRISKFDYEFRIFFEDLSESLRKDLEAKCIAIEKTGSRDYSSLKTSTASKIADKTNLMLREFEAATSSHAKLKIITDYESDFKRIRGWRKFANVLIAVVFGLVGFVAGAAIGCGAGLLMGSFTGPGAIVTAALGLVHGAVSGAAAGVLVAATATGIAVASASATGMWSRFLKPSPVNEKALSMAADVRLVINASRVK